MARLPADGVARIDRLLAMEPDWRAFLSRGLSEEEAGALRRGERTGRPLGSDGFVEMLEKQTGRALKKRKTGPRTRVDI